MYRVIIKISFSTSSTIPLIIGFLVGISVFHIFSELSFEQTSSDANLRTSPYQIYDSSLANRLIDEIRILCLIFTHPKNHRTKSLAVRDTWGRQCTKLLFVTSQPDPELETVALKVNESRNALRNKTRESFLLLQREYINDYDWFLKADDDSSVIMENVRYMLYQYRTRTSLFFGHRFATKELPEGYMSGATYILSRAAVTKFAHRIVRSSITDPFFKDGAGEDVNMGRILAREAIFVDERDEKLQKRFFPLSVTNHLSQPNITNDYWYIKTLYYNVSDGGLGCCSDVPISFHYSSGSRNWMIEYLVHHVHAFGVTKNLTESLPRKLTLDEIIEASDAKSYAPNFFEHEDVHKIDSSERF